MRRIISTNAVIITLLAMTFCIYPSWRALLDLRDPALRGPGIPRMAQRLFVNLTPHYTSWARNRIAQGSAEHLDYRNVSGTEWPLFGSVFFLWGVENLQNAWDNGDHSGAGTNLSRYPEGRS